MNQISSRAETNTESKNGPACSAIGLTLFLHPAPTGPAQRRQAAVRSRFEGLGGGPDLGETAVERWPKTVTTPIEAADDTASAAIERYERFEAAVSAAGGRLEPFVQRRGPTGGRLVNATEGDVYTVPVCCLAVRQADAITGLYPCWLDGYHYSVAMGLAAVEDGDPNNVTA